MNKWKKFLPLLLGAVAAIGMIFGMRLQQTLEYDGLTSKKINNAPEESVMEALKHIKSKYYGHLDYDEFIDVTLSNIVEGLDPYSHYFPELKDENYNNYVNGLYEGIGVEYTSYRDSLFITTLIEGSPAEQSGIRRGDILLGIEGIDIIEAQLQIDSIRSLSSKEVGDTIQLTVWHRELDEIEDHSIRISQVSLPLVKSFVIEDNPQVAYMRIERFYSGVFRDFMDELDAYKKDSMDVEHLIIDLRGNLGGVVDETIKLLNQFFADKEVTLLSTINNANNTQVYKSNGRVFNAIGKIVVVVDERSASASEIMAAVLQDHDRAVVLGTNSYGKGVIQQNYDLSNQGSMNLTVGAYVLPSGRLISKNETSDSTYYSIKNERELPFAGQGVTPDVLFDYCKAEKELSIQQFIIHDNLWDRSDLMAFINERPGSAEVLMDSCQLQQLQKQSWEMIELSFSNEELVHSRYLDPLLNEALKVLVSDRYEYILGDKKR